jgi:hypothetical protein
VLVVDKSTHLVGYFTNNIVRFDTKAGCVVGKIREKIERCIGEECGEGGKALQ